MTQRVFQVATIAVLIGGVAWFALRAWNLSGREAAVDADIRGYRPAILAVQVMDEGRSLLSVALTPDNRWEVRSWKFPEGLGETPPVLLEGEAISLESEHAVPLVAVSDDGQRTATAVGDPLAKAGRVLVHQADGSLLLDLDLSGPVTALGLAPGGEILAVGVGVELQLRQLPDGELLHKTEHEYFVSAIAFTPDGKWVASGTHRDVHICGPGTDELPWGDVRLTSMSAPYDSQEVADPEQPAFVAGVDGLAFSPDGQTLAIAHGGRVRLWDREQQAFTTTLPPRGSEPGDEPGEEAGGERLRKVTALRYSPDSKWLAVGCEFHESTGHPRRIHLWDVSKAQRVAELSAHRTAILDFAFSADSRYLVSAAGDTRLWDLSERESPIELQREHVLDGHDFFLTSLAFSPDGETMASGAKDGSIKFWETSEFHQVHMIDCEQSVEGGFEVNAVAFTPDSELFLFAGGVQQKYGEVHVLAGPRANALFKLRGHSAPVESMAISPDGQLLVTASSDETVVVWDLATGEKLHTISGLKTSVRDVTVKIADDGTLFTRFHPAQLWNARTGELQGDLEHPSSEHGPYAAAFRPGGQKLVTGGHDGLLTLWDVASREALATRHVHLWQISSVAISSDAQWGAAGLDRSVTFFDATFPWRQGIHSTVGVATAEGLKDRVYGLAFSPTDDLFAAGSQDGQIHIYSY